MQEGNEESGGASRGDEERREEERIETDEEWYHDVAIDCFRYLGMKSLVEVDRLTLREYNWLMEAYSLREIDDDFRAHRSAYLGLVVSKKKKNGQYVYSDFKKFYDHKKEEEKITNKKEPSKFSALSKHLKDKQEKD